MRYYDEFDRKMYAYDANTDEYKYVVNDDTVSFSHNGTEIEGAYEPEKDTAAYSKHFITEELEGKKPKDIKTTMEPKELYYIRTFFLFLSVLFQVAIAAIFVCLILMLCNLTIQSWTGENFNPRSMNVRRINRQGALMRAMQSLPYS